MNAAGRVGCAVPAVAMSLWLTGCVSLHSQYARTATTALSETDDTRLGRAVTPVATQHSGQSGVCPLSRGTDAFAARMALADAAHRSLDVQYYIWHGDDTGKLLAERLLAAADRGVRVRVLLDDFGSSAKDESLLALDSHPNIEVRLFNPLAIRGARVLGSLVDFSRTTRRMHNKSFTADNQVTIVGGRNVGDEYFEANAALDFADLDVLAVGPVVRDVSASFDLFWNSAAAYPIAAVNRQPVLPAALAKRRRELTDHVAAMKRSPYVAAVKETQLVQQLQDGQLAFAWCQAWTVYDWPEKVAGIPAPERQLLHQLRPTADATKQELVVVSPYAVPGRKGLAFFRELRRRGIRVVLVTNSLASTDTVPVHAGYSRYRKELLRMGVELYELKPTAALRRSGTQNASLHAKSFAFDRRVLFIGSFNLDPRSAFLNTELGVVFESPELAGPMVESLEARLDRMAWRVESVPGPEQSTRLNWVTQEGNRTVRKTVEPDCSFSRRLIVALIGWLPVEDQL
jgi:putative cardiolipin synthase